MAFAVTLLFDPATSDAISARWKRLADAGLSNSMLDLGYRPHVTLAVYDELAVDAAVAALDRVFDDVGQMAVTLTGLSTFGPGSGVCYVALAPSPDMMELHATIVGAIGEICHPYDQIEHWIPHCTLATGMTDAEMGRAENLLGGEWRPLTGMFETA